MEFTVNIDYKKIGLEEPQVAPKLTAYVLENSNEFSKDRVRRAVLVCPGGGYGYTSDREAEPIALKFLSEDVTVFVLRYSVAPYRYPTQLVQVGRSLELIRQNAAEWNIDKDKVVVCGFSAGGHLTASIGTLWNKVLPQYGFDGDDHKPNGLILAYPVISSGECGHMGSFVNLLGENRTQEQMDFLSLENQVSSDTPPSFIWHTYQDSCVPVLNSLLFASAMAKENIPFELHVYPKGGHGLSLANEIVCKPDDCIPKVQRWIDLAIEWVKAL